MTDRKKIVYIAGPITGVAEYWVPFERAEDEIEAQGYVALTPTRLPYGMSKADYMRICFAMIDSADAVLLVGNWPESGGANLERHYCEYIDKPYADSVEKLQKILEG